MSFKKSNNDIKVKAPHPLAEPLFGHKEDIRNIKITFEDTDSGKDTCSKHPFFNVKSGLPSNLGEALGDLDPDRTAKTLLAVIYGLRGIKKITQTAKFLWNTKFRKLGPDTYKSAEEKQAWDKFTAAYYRGSLWGSDYKDLWDSSEDK